MTSIEDGKSRGLEVLELVASPLLRDSMMAVFRAQEPLFGFESYTLAVYCRTNRIPPRMIFTELTRSPKDLETIMRAVNVAHGHVHQKQLDHQHFLGSMDTLCFAAERLQILFNMMQSMTTKQIEDWMEEHKRIVAEYARTHQRS
jgi:hypothetical protein